MKKYLMFLGLFLLPASGNAIESAPPPIHVLDESSSFQIARAYKLGLMEDSGMNPSGKDYEGKTGLCSKDSDCSEGQACKGNACTDVCSPNPCSGGYKCIAGGHSYTCVQCTADSDCASNKKCSNNICIDACSGNNCASQSKKCTTNSSHGYTCYGCTSDAACPNDQRCDTRTSACVALCPSACEGNMICTVTGSHKATCSCESDANCPAGQTCDTATKQCVAADCGGMLTATRSDVAVATDAASFTTAMSSGKNIIAVTDNLTAGSEIALGSKKLVGPKYFSDIPVCKETNTPTLTSAAPMTISGGEINQMDVKFSFNDKAKDGISGSGTIADSSVSTTLAKSVVAATGKMTLQGKVTLHSAKDNADGYANQGVLQTNGGSVEIAGNTTLSGDASYGLWIGANTTATIASSGTLVLNMPDVFVGIDLGNNSTFTANGPVKFDARASSAIGYITTGKAVINLNANGNYIKTSYSGLMQTYGDITIKGTTTIECDRGTNTCDTCGCTAIDSHETYSNSINSVTINAPLTLVNFNRAQGEQYPTISGDTILKMVGGTLKINNTIESKSGYGKVLTNGDSMSMTSSGAILGASYLYGRMQDMSISAGAKIKLGGVCKKAASSGKVTTVTYDKAATSASTLGSPFTGGC